MAQHVYTGNGAPPPSLQALPGSHYIDLDTGKQYLFGSAWVEGGGGSGGGLVYAVWDAAANNIFRPDPAVATAYLISGVPSSNAPLKLELGAIDDLNLPEGKNCEILVELDNPMVVNFYTHRSAIRISLSGVTYDANEHTLSLINATDRMRMRITQLGAGLYVSDRVLLMDVSVVTAVDPQR